MCMCVCVFTTLTRVHRPSRLVYVYCYDDVCTLRVLAAIHVLLLYYTIIRSYFGIFYTCTQLKRCFSDVPPSFVLLVSIKTVLEVPNCRALLRDEFIAFTIRYYSSTHTGQ